MTERTEVAARARRVFDAWPFAWTFYWHSQCARSLENDIEHRMAMLERIRDTLVVTTAGTAAEQQRMCNDYATRPSARSEVVGINWVICAPCANVSHSVLAQTCCSVRRRRRPRPGDPHNFAAVQSAGCGRRRLAAASALTRRPTAWRAGAFRAAARQRRHIRRADVSRLFHPAHCEDAVVRHTKGSGLGRALFRTLHRTAGCGASTTATVPSF